MQALKIKGVPHLAKDNRERVNCHNHHGSRTFDYRFPSDTIGNSSLWHHSFFSDYRQRVSFADIFGYGRIFKFQRNVL